MGACRQGLYESDILLSDIQFLPQGEKRLSKLQKVDTLDLEQVVYVEHLPKLTFDNSISGILQPNYEVNENQIHSSQFNCLPINTSNFDVQTRCQELIQLHGIRGFKYTIKKPIASASARIQTFKFASAREWHASRNACLDISKKEYYEANGLVGFAYGRLGGDLPDEEDSLKKCYTRAIAASQAIKEIFTFEIEKIELDDEGLKLIQEITAESDKLKQVKKAMQFLKTYPEEINFGPFGVGGWFQYTAETTSSKKTNLHTLHDRATKEIETKLSLNGKVSTVTQRDIIPDDTLATTISYQCSGPTVYELGQLEDSLAKSRDWSCFPSIAVPHHKFKNICRIIRDHQNTKDDVKRKELEDGADILERMMS